MLPHLAASKRKVAQRRSQSIPSIQWQMHATALPPSHMRQGYVTNAAGVRVHHGTDAALLCEAGSLPGGALPA